MGRPAGGGRGPVPGRGGRRRHGGGRPAPPRAGHRGLRLRQRLERPDRRGGPGCRGARPPRARAGEGQRAAARLRRPGRRRLPADRRRRHLRRGGGPGDDPHPPRRTARPRARGPAPAGRRRLPAGPRVRQPVLQPPHLLRLPGRGRGHAQRLPGDVAPLREVLPGAVAAVRDRDRADRARHRLPGPAGGAARRVPRPAHRQREQAAHLPRRVPHPAHLQPAPGQGAAAAGRGRAGGGAGPGQPGSGPAPGRGVCPHRPRAALPHRDPRLRGDGPRGGGPGARDRAQRRGVGAQGGQAAPLPRSVGAALARSRPGGGWPPGR